jgi:hypothetical protein
MSEEYSAIQVSVCTGKTTGSEITTKSEAKCITAQENNRLLKMLTKSAMNHFYSSVSSKRCDAVSFKINKDKICSET